MKASFATILLQLCLHFFGFSCATAAQLKSFPIAQFGGSEPKTIVAYVWSYNCELCRSEFRENIFPLLRRAAIKKDILLLLIQKESNPTIISNDISQALCRGKSFYEAHALAYLMFGFAVERTASISEKMGVRTDTCDNIDSVRAGLINYFRLQNDASSPIASKEAPFVILDGHVIDEIGKPLRKFR